jgi:hypothetical protein
LKDRVRPGPDLQVRVELIHLDDDGYSVAVPGDYTPNAAQLRLMGNLDIDTAEQLSNQLRSVGGVDTEDLTLRLVVRGHSNQEVRILDIRPLAQRARPVSGTLFSIPPQEGRPSMDMMLELDDPIPLLRTLVITEAFKLKGGRPFFESNSIRLADGEQDVLVIRATANRYSVEFKLEIRYLIGGDEKRTIVDYHGRPFAVSGMHCGQARGFASYLRAYELTYGSEGQLRLVPVRHPERYETQLPGVCGWMPSS